MYPKDPEAKNLLATYAAKPIEIKRTQKDKTVLTSITKEVIYDNIQLPAIFMGYKFPEQLNTVCFFKISVRKSNKISVNV